MGNIIILDIYFLFRELKELHVLELRYNSISHLPEEFGELTQLVKLDLSYNQLLDLPYTFMELKALKVIHVAEIKIKKLW